MSYARAIDGPYNYNARCNALACKMDEQTLCSTSNALIPSTECTKQEGFGLISSSTKKKELTK